MELLPAQRDDEPQHFEPVVIVIGAPSARFCVGNALRVKFEGLCCIHATLLCCHLPPLLLHKKTSLDYPAKLNSRHRVADTASRIQTGAENDALIVQHTHSAGRVR